MAKDKKGFVLYADMKEIFDKLPDEKAGELIKHIFAYVNDEDPEPKDLIIDIAFASIKTQLKRDLKKYKQTCEKNRENILKRWNKKDTNVYERIPTDTKHTDIDNDNDKEIGIDNNKDKFKLKFDYFISKFNEISKRKFKGDDKTKRQFKDRLSNGYTWDDFKIAIINLYKDEYHKENNFKYATPEFITRADKLEMYLNKYEMKSKEGIYPDKLYKRDKNEPDLLKTIQNRKP